MEKAIVVIGNQSQLLTSVYSMVNDDPLFKVAVLIHSGTEAMRYITERKPDVILTELELADLDGLSIINQVYKDDDYNPFIYALSSMYSDSLMMTLSRLDVAYVSVKPSHPESVYDNLVLLIGNLNIIETFRAKRADRLAELQIVSSETERNQKRITAINVFLSRLGVNMSFHSAYCAMQTIKFQMCCAEQDQYKTAGELYKQVVTANADGLTPSAVERSIRSTIKTINDTRNKFYIQVFGKERLTARKFIGLSSMYLLRQEETEQYAQQSV